jgi:hypothetical protein
MLIKNILDWLFIYSGVPGVTAGKFTVSHNRFIIK